MPGRNQDYQKGYQIGQWIFEKGEDLEGFKGVDQISQELLDELGWPDLPVSNADAFKEGLLNGYKFSEQQAEKRDQ